uniref:Secreted protein n=1 Tax=Heterorhabditis bacteriophora TaxID=37862 RepID=A0A1I7X3H4_HETBA
MSDNLIFICSLLRIFTVLARWELFSTDCVVDESNPKEYDMCGTNILITIRTTFISAGSVPFKNRKAPPFLSPSSCQTRPMDNCSTIVIKIAACKEIPSHKNSLSVTSAKR